MAKRDYNIKAVRYGAVIEEPISGTKWTMWGAEKAVTERAKEEIKEALSGIEVEPYILIARIIRVTEYYHGESRREEIQTIQHEAGVKP